jgi:hypothetical protein
LRLPLQQLAQRCYTIRPTMAVTVGGLRVGDSDYDIDMIDAVLAAAASERLPGDPPWLLIVSGSGGAKTETVQTRRWTERPQSQA